MTTLIFDTETTGISDAELISAAWLQVDAPDTLKVIDSFDQFYQPAKPISLGAMAVHHIMDEDLVGCPAASNFALPTGTEYLIGHNIDFDWQVIGQPDVKRIDTLCLCRKHWPKADAHSQSSMLYLLERETARERLKDAHSAAADVEVCKTILSHILERTKSGSWEELWMASEEARVPERMPFGKHKGERIKDMPSDYKRWLLKQSDVDPYLARALQD
jgi:exodeoxyribonuclease X